MTLPFISPNELAGKMAIQIGGLPLTYMTNFGTPSAVTSTTGKMMGFGAPTTGNATYAPQYSTRLKVVWQGTAAYSGVAAPATVLASYGTGTPPAYAATVTGTQVGLGFSNTIVAAAEATGFPFQITTFITGLTVGTVYWMDLDVYTSTGTITLTNVSLIIEEV